MRSAMHHNQINFAKSAAVVALEKLQTGIFQQAQGGLFALVSFTLIAQVSALLVTDSLACGTNFTEGQVATESAAGFHP